MARRPVKKRKQRKLSDTTAFQKVKQLVERNFASDPAPDPFEIAAPKGKAYQWASLHPDSKFELATYKKSGWRPVPAARHREFPSEKGKIVLDGSILLEISRKRYEKMTGSGIARAKAQMQQQDTMLGRDYSDGRHTIQIMPDDWVDSQDYDHPQGEFIDIDVNITMRVPWRWRDAASALKLEPSEYARRRLIMYSQGLYTGLLVPIAPPTPSRWDKAQYEMVPFEFIENANLVVRRKD
jgi:hypothetical protein